jgi:hypothetical protein
MLCTTFGIRRSLRAMLASFTAAVERARAALAADGGRLWGIDLTGARWIGADGDIWYATEDPGRPDFRPDGPFWRGPRPAGTTTGNTNIEWVGRPWALVQLPDADVRVLIHEWWHAGAAPRLIPDLGSEMSVPGGDLLDTAAGRVWLRSEAAALHRGLTEPGSDGLQVAASCRLGRKQAATADEWAREKALELCEGLPEYTAWRLSGASSPQVAEWLAELPIDRSLVRSFAYYVVPAYGFLLDEVDPDWRRKALHSRDLTRLGMSGAAPDADIVAAESVRDQQRAAAAQATRLRFIEGPVLRIRPPAMNIDFNPQRVRNFDFGTVYGSLTWRTADGAELRVDGEAVVTPDWAEIQVPLDNNPAELPTSGPGWTLVPPNWPARRDDRGWLIAPQA